MKERYDAHVSLHSTSSGAFFLAPYNATASIGSITFIYIYQTLSFSAFLHRQDLFSFAIMTTPVPNVDLEGSQQHVTLKATIPFAVLAVISVVCRFLSRKIQKLRFEFDDYMSLAALIFTLGCFTLSLEMTYLGSGKHLTAVPLENIPQYFKVES